MLMRPFWELPTSQAQSAHAVAPIVAAPNRTGCMQCAQRDQGGPARATVRCQKNRRFRARHRRHSGTSHVRRLRLTKLAGESHLSQHFLLCCSCRGC